MQGFFYSDLTDVYLGHINTVGRASSGRLAQCLPFSCSTGLFYVTSTVSITDMVPTKCRSCLLHLRTPCLSANAVDNNQTLYSVEQLIFCYLSPHLLESKPDTKPQGNLVCG